MPQNVPKTEIVIDDYTDCMSIDGRTKQIANINIGFSIQQI